MNENTELKNKIQELEETMQKRSDRDLALVNKMAAKIRLLEGTIEQISIRNITLEATTVNQANLIITLINESDGKVAKDLKQKLGKAQINQQENAVRH